MTDTIELTDPAKMPPIRALFAPYDAAPPVVMMDDVIDVSGRTYAAKPPWQDLGLTDARFPTRIYWQSGLTVWLVEMTFLSGYATLPPAKQAIRLACCTLDVNHQARLTAFQNVRTWTVNYLDGLTEGRTEVQFICEADPDLRDDEGREIVWTAFTLEHA